MARIRWRHLDPWSNAFWDVGRLQREVNSLFDSVWPGRGERQAEFPAFNVWSKGDNVIVAAELPGVKPEEIDLAITQSVLTVKGERKAEEKGEKCAWHRQERRVGSFARSIELPEKVDAEKASASYCNGVLTVTLPKSADAKPKQIKVNG